jgi:hypothetical protein
MDIGAKGSATASRPQALNRAEPLPVVREQSTTTTTGSMKALYLDDTITTCECCGRTELKATVAMQLSDGGILHYGRTCAARNSGKTSQQITKEMRRERDLDHGRCGNYLADMRRSGVKITRDVVREVHALFPAADPVVLLRHWA